MADRVAFLSEEELRARYQDQEEIIRYVMRLHTRIRELEERFAKNSRNSSKPPSSDGLKPAAKRGKPAKARRPGGQKGHPGAALEMTDEPDHVEIHAVDRCAGCHRSLEDVPAKGFVRRQVFDLPPERVEATEHRGEIKECPHCDHVTIGAFPEEVDHPVQYGPRVKALVVYLNQQQLIPYKRIEDIFESVFSHRLRAGFVFNANRDCYLELERFEDVVRERLKDSPVVCLDETGCRVNKTPVWLHTASTDEVTLYFIHAGRGRAAMDEMGVLPGYLGTAVHDCYHSYFGYGCTHGLCNAHLVRELIFQHEVCGQQWAADMIVCLLAIKKRVDECKQSSASLPRREKRAFEKRFEKILKRGFRANPLPQTAGRSPATPGRQKKTKTRNLLERIRDRQKDFLAFMYDFKVPFTNNLAERDLRMAKVKQKVSGCYRSWEGARISARIRSYISTARKCGLNVIEAIRHVFTGDAFMPAKLE